MRILRQNIAAQKAQIMKNLELNNCDKNKLDEDISKLQQLQKQYFQYEKDIAYSDDLSNRVDCCISSDDGDISSEDILRGGHSDVNSNSSEGRENKEKGLTVGSDDNTVTHSISYQSGSLISRSQLSSNCKHKFYFISFSILLNYLYAKFDRFFQHSTDDSEFFIGVPSYVIRGAGKHTHFEYEIRITLPDDKWSLMRRYSRFRELHISLKSFYGEKVCISTLLFTQNIFFLI